MKAFKAHQELEELDRRINSFIQENHIRRVISVSDAPTTDSTGATIGLVRVLVYEE